MKKAFVRCLIAMFLVLIGVDSTIVGAGTTPLTINMGAKGSISINKIAEDMKPISDVTFSGVKVADIAGNIYGKDINYTLTDIGKEMFNTLGDKIELSINELEAELININRVDVARYTINATTDASGLAEVNNLDLGVYLIEEIYNISEMPFEAKDIVSSQRAVPFLVTLPLTMEEGNEWIYESMITIKDKVSNESIVKSVKGEHIILTDKGELTGAIGSPMWYTLTGTITSGATHSPYYYYGFRDMITYGLTYGEKGDSIEDFKSKVIVKIGDVYVADKSDYILNVFEDEKGWQFSVVFTKNGLDKLNEQAYLIEDDNINDVSNDDINDSKNESKNDNINNNTDNSENDSTDNNINNNIINITVSYPAHLNEESVLYEGNNIAYLTYGHEGQPLNIKSDSKEFKPLALEIEKLFENTNVANLPKEAKIDPKRVMFTLGYKYNDDYKKIYVKPIDGIAGSYIADFSIESASNGYDQVFPCNSEGSIKIYGLPKGKYILTELTTVNGYSLLSKDIEVSLDIDKTEFRNVKKVITEVEAKGLVSTYILSSCNIGIISEEDLKETNSDIINKSIENNIASVHYGKVTVNSERSPVFELPGTGGEGTNMYTILGSALMAGAMMLYITFNRKKYKH